MHIDAWTFVHLMAAGASNPTRLVTESLNADAVAASPWGR